jgi:hypothetical protein
MFSLLILRMSFQSTILRGPVIGKAASLNHEMGNFARISADVPY